MTANLNQTLSELAGEQRLDYFGVADLSGPDAQAFIREQNGAMSGYPRAVAIGIVLSHELIDLLPEGDESIRAMYKYHIYGVTAQRADQATALLASVLQRAGYRALAIPAAVVAIDPSRLAGVFSHKIAARLAGLGWIGKSCMLITPQHGPRVAWATVLTDAPLTATGTPMASRCGNCRACADACPAGAYTGREFHPDEPRSARFDVAACRRHVESLDATGPESRTCGRCLQACPFGKPRKKRREALDKTDRSV